MLHRTAARPTFRTGRHGATGKTKTSFLDADQAADEFVLASERVENLRYRLEAQSKWFERDEAGKKAASELQDLARALLVARYGETTDLRRFRVRMEVLFDPSVPGAAITGPEASFTIELLPVSLFPVSVYHFLEMARVCNTHLNDPDGLPINKKNRFLAALAHIVSARCEDFDWKLPIQEYSPDFPHQEQTMGWSGRPGGPQFYVSLIDNTVGHGPNSQGDPDPYRADAPIGKVIEGWKTAINRLRWIGERQDGAFIGKMTILVPNEDGKYVEWSRKL